MVNRNSNTSFLMYCSESGALFNSPEKHSELDWVDEIMKETSLVEEDLEGKSKKGKKYYHTNIYITAKDLLQRSFRQMCNMPRDVKFSLGYSFISSLSNILITYRRIYDETDLNKKYESIVELYALARDIESYANIFQTINVFKRNAFTSVMRSVGDLERQILAYKASVEKKINNRNNTLK